MEEEYRPIDTTDMTQTERWAVGYYTPEEIQENNVPKEKVVGLLNGGDGIKEREPFGIEGEWPNLEYTEGSFYTIGETFLPACREIEGHISIREQTSFISPKCIEIKGCLDIHQESKIQTPSLKDIGDQLEIRSNVSVEIPSLKNIGSIYIMENVSLKLPSAEKIGGVETWKNCSIDAPKALEIGYIHTFEKCSLKFPSVETVHGYIHSCSMHFHDSDGARIELSSAKTVHGEIWVDAFTNSNMPSLKEVKGDIHILPHATINLQSLEVVEGRMTFGEMTSVHCPQINTVKEALADFRLVKPQDRKLAEIRFDESGKIDLKYTFMNKTGKYQTRNASLKDNMLTVFHPKTGEAVTRFDIKTKEVVEFSVKKDLSISTGKGRSR